MLLTGAASGVLAGLLGIGGGIVIVPVLEAVLALLDVDREVRMHIAVATSLAVIVPTSISSAAAHYRKSAVDLAIARRWSIFIFFGAIAGIVISAFVSGRFLAGVFAVFAALLAVNMILHVGERKLGERLPASPSFALLPFGIGTVSTLMGIGGGSLTVPSLTAYGKPIHVAVGTSSLLGLVIAVPAAVGYVITGWGNSLLPVGSLGYVNLFGFALITPASVLFAPLGAKIAHAVSRRQLSTLFGGFLLVAAARMGFQAL